MRHSHLQPSELRDPGDNLVVRVNDLASYPGETEDTMIGFKKIGCTGLKEFRATQDKIICMSHSNHYIMKCLKDAHQKCDLKNTYVFQCD